MRRTENPVTPKARLTTAAVVAACALAMTACSRSHVLLPADTASPQDVVRAYADAVHTGDCVTASALVANSTSSWCGSIDVTALSVTETTQEKREVPGGGGLPIERVWVHLTSHGGDISLPDGGHLWSYLLDRTGPHGAWRIYDQGMG